MTSPDADIPATSPESATDVGQDQPSRRTVIRWLVVLLVGSLVLGLIWDRVFGRLIPLDPDAITEWFNRLGAWAPIVYILAMIGAVVISPIPSLPLDIAAGLAFGLLRGSVYTLIGAEIGAIIAFLISRRVGRPWLARRLSPATMIQIDKLSDRMGFKAVVVMRLLPLFNFDWVSYAAGLTSMPLPRFALATLIGMTPTVIAITAVGSNATTNPRLALAILAGLVLLFVAPVVVALVRAAIDRRQPEERQGRA